MCHQGIWVQMGTIRTHKKVLAPLKSNFKVDSTSKYGELTTLYYPMILDRDRKLEAMTY